MSAAPTQFPETINEGSTAVYRSVLRDEEGVTIPDSVINTLTLTLSHVGTGAIINSRNGQNVLNANNVTVDGSGNLVFALQALDTVIIDDTQSKEYHRATFQCRFDTNKHSNWDVDFRIRNLEKVPTA